MTNRLHSHIQRLYRLPGDAGAADDAMLHLVGSDARARAMVLALRQPADWGVLSAVWRGVQADLELPAPAIAVNGVDAFELWFSLAEAVPLAQADAFLRGLCLRYLASVKPPRVQCIPSLDGGAAKAASSHAVALVPAPRGESGHWSAFVAPDLAAVFGDEPVLDLPPGADAQADLLSRLSSIKPAAFENALALLRSDVVPPASASPPVAVPAAAWTGATATYQDPRRFLMDVMNDTTVALSLRIESARALLEAGGGVK